jgi:serine/threonine protein kinase
VSGERDPLLELALAVADGGDVQWEGRPVEASDPDRSEALVRGLRRLAALRERLQGDAGSAEAPRAPADGGWTWGHLQVGEVLGKGSFGEVYRAYDPVLRRPVALKLRVFRGGGAQSTFLAEARRLARVRHPNVLAVYGADVHGGRAGLWADLLRGRTLERHLADGTAFSPGRVLEIARQLSEALAAVHRAGIVHGDVKGSNVMLEPDGWVVLMDFGAGTDSAEVGEGEGEAVAGSPLSMAPELFTAEAATRASDVYSLGVLVFRLLTGRYPVEAPNLADLARRHREGRPSPWRPGDRPPRSLRRLVDALLAADPDHRPSAQQLLDELDAIAAQPRRRHRRLAVAAVIASLLLALTASTAGWLAARRSAQRAEAARREAEATTAFLSDLLLAPDITRQGPGVRVLDVMNQARARAESTLAAPSSRGGSFGSSAG